LSGQLLIFLNRLTVKNDVLALAALGAAAALKVKHIIQQQEMLARQVGPSFPGDCSHLGNYGDFYNGANESRPGSGRLS